MAVANITQQIGNKKIKSTLNYINILHFTGII